MRYIATLIALVAIAGVASAAVETVVNDYASFPGYCVNTISADFGTDEWVTAELIILPDANGMIYQGNYSYEQTVPPPPRTITVDPWTSSEYQSTLDYYGITYDTRIATGVFYEGASEAVISKESAPATEEMYVPTLNNIVLPDLSELNKGTDIIRITWWTQALVETGDLDLAMVTLLEGTTGTWSFRAFDQNSASIPSVDLSGPGYIIDNGALVPEPATMLVMMGGLGVLLRRRRK